MFGTVLFAICIVAFSEHTTKTTPQERKGLKSTDTLAFVYGFETDEVQLEKKSEGKDPFLTDSGGPDSFGYRFFHIPFNFLDLQDRTVDSTVNEVELGDDESFDFALPHPFCLYDRNIDTIRVSSNGYLTVPPEPGGAVVNTSIPDSNPPNNLIALFWDDLWGSGGPPDREVRYQFRVGGTRTIDTTIIQYNKWGYFADIGQARHTFQVLLESTGYITFNYLNIDSSIIGPPFSATGGIENSTGTIGLLTDFNQQFRHIKDSTSIRFSPPDPYPCPIGIEEFIPQVLPTRIFLHQNIPNPFHHSTSIRFALTGVRGQGSGISVKLIVYDLTGRLVVTLVDGLQNPGIYQLLISSNQLPGSGIYFYHLETDDFTITRKMVLLK